MELVAEGGAKYLHFRWRETNTLQHVIKMPLTSILRRLERSLWMPRPTRASPTFYPCNFVNKTKRSLNLSFSLRTIPLQTSSQYCVYNFPTLFSCFINQKYRTDVWSCPVIDYVLSNYVKPVSVCSTHLLLVGPEFDDCIGS